MTPAFKSHFQQVSQLFDELMPHAAELAEHAAAEGHPSVPLQGYQTLESGNDVVRLLLARCHPLPCSLPRATCWSSGH